MLQILMSEKVIYEYSYIDKKVSNESGNLQHVEVNVEITLILTFNLVVDELGRHRDTKGPEQTN